MPKKSGAFDTHIEAGLEAELSAWIVEYEGIRDKVGYLWDQSRTKSNRRRSRENDRFLEWTRNTLVAFCAGLSGRSELDLRGAFKTDEALRSYAMQLSQSSQAETLQPVDAVDVQPVLEQAVRVYADGVEIFVRVAGQLGMSVKDGQRKVFFRRFIKLFILRAELTSPGLQRMLGAPERRRMHSSQQVFSFLDAYFRE